MARPKGQLKPKEQEPQQPEQLPETPVVRDSPKQAAEAVDISLHDTTIYHNEHEPRNIKKGDIVPSGWTREPRTLTVKWQNNIDGTWFKIPV